MMQQPISQQHDQMGGQQALSQPMVLCPVRFVYETQILVQPGDHIQPNQTFFINTQNPPPWMQNSLQNSLQTRQAMSSPVVYVQHVPNNIVSSVQQPIDQNQLYLQQNFANFQLQQQMLAQNQDMRQAMQLANIVPNMVQNIQTNVANDRSGPHNNQIQTNNQMIQVQNQMNRPVQNQMNQMEVSRQVMLRPQVHQQTNTPRPMIAMNQVQSMPQQTVTVPNIAQNVSHAVSNMGRPSPNMNIVRAPAPNNVVSIQPLSKIRDTVPSDPNKSSNNPHANVVPTQRTFVPNYFKAIQPRPQTSHNIAHLPKTQQHIPVQTVQSAPMYNHDRNNSQQNTNNNYAIVQQLNNPINRKRKSESPDEIQNKMIISAPKHNQQPFMTITKIVNEIGTNTSPVHRPRVNTQVKTNNAPVTNVRSCGSIIENMIKEAIMPEKDKLIRNTVYTQARGRVLQDKVEEIKPQIENRSEPIKIMENRVVDVVQMDVREETKTVDVNKGVQTIESIANTENNTIEIKTNIIDDTNVVDMDKNISININNETIENKPDNFKENLEVTSDSNHIEIVVNYIKKTDVPVTPIKDKVTEEINKEVPINNKNDEDQIKMKKEDKQKTKVTEANNLKEANNKTIKQENINILTHVVDGYVIQESNVAFPIRKPLKEKTLHTNMKSEPNEEKDLIRESIKEELKNNVDIPLLPFHYLMLDSAKEEKEKAEEKRVAEKKADEKRTAEKKAEEKRAAEKKAEEKRAAEKKAEEKRMAEKKAEEKLREEKKKAEEKLREEKMAEEEMKMAEAMKMDVDNTEDQPFLQLQHSIVKNWTVEEVCNHLLKFNWKETVSLFHDHEIDGESLLLVSKQQLITIGVKEDHADIICDFVKG